MKRILLITLMFITSIYGGQSQSYKKMDHDPTAFLGKWVATANDTTYELTITKGDKWFDEPWNILVEVLYGEITYIKDGKIIKKRGKDEILPEIIGSADTTNIATFLMYDMSDHIGANLKLTLDAGDPNIVKWTMTLTDRLGGRLPKREFDVPFEMTFRRVTE